MTRDLEELGGHAGLDAHALTKQEVAALLCAEGHRAGFWCVPEFEIDGDKLKRRIDVVWACRDRNSQSLWQPIAAFEIEGHDVAGESIDKNVDSLGAAKKAKAAVCAMVLFQAGPRGEPWGGKIISKSVDRVARRVSNCHHASLAELGIDVVLDKDLRDRLGPWIEMARSHRLSSG